MKNQILGISGTNASGKDTLAKYLFDKHQFLFVSTSDILREEAQQRYGNILRPTLFKVGNELRLEKGPSVLVDFALHKYNILRSEYPGGVVISSIRTTGEADKIHAAGGKIVFLDADAQLRYQHMQSRGRLDDQITFEKFVEEEKAEMHQSDDPGEFSILGVKSRADIQVENSHDIADFLKNAEQVLGLTNDANG